MPNIRLVTASPPTMLLNSSGAAPVDVDCCCLTCSMWAQIVTSSLVKCGIVEYQPSSPPLVRIYLVQDWAFSGSTTLSESGGTPTSPCNCANGQDYSVSGGPFSTTYDMTTCMATNSPPGPWTFTVSQGQCDGSTVVLHPSFANCNDPCGYYDFPQCPVCPGGSCSPSDCSGCTNAITSPTSRGGITSFECSCNPLTDCVGPPPNPLCCNAGGTTDNPCNCSSNGSGSCSGTLSSEYTTSQLITNVIAALPAWPGFTPASTPYEIAQRNLSTDERGYSIRRGQFYFAIPVQTRDVIIQYDEVWYPQGGTPTPTHMSVTIPAGSTTTATTEIDEPATNGYIQIENMTCAYAT